MSDVVAMLGTTKGTFLVRGRERAEWSVSGPFCNGWTINHVVADPESGTIWAGGGGDFTGAGVWRSEDGGATGSVAKIVVG